MNVSIVHSKCTKLCSLLRDKPLPDRAACGGFTLATSRQVTESMAFTTAVCFKGRSAWLQHRAGISQAYQPTGLCWCAGACRKNTERESCKELSACPEMYDRKLPSLVTERASWCFLWLKRAARPGRLGSPHHSALTARTNKYAVAKQSAMKDVGQRSVSPKETDLANKQRSHIQMMSYFLYD